MKNLKKTVNEKFQTSSLIFTKTLKNLSHGLLNKKDGKKER